MANNTIKLRFRIILSECYENVIEDNLPKNNVIEAKAMHKISSNIKIHFLRPYRNFR